MDIDPESLDHRYESKRNPWLLFGGHATLRRREENGRVWWSNCRFASSAVMNAKWGPVHSRVHEQDNWNGRRAETLRSLQEQQERCSVSIGEAHDQAQVAAAEKVLLLLAFELPLEIYSQRWLAGSRHRTITESCRKRARARSNP